MALKHSLHAYISASNPTLFDGDHPDATNDGEYNDDKCHLGLSFSFFAFSCFSLLRDHPDATNDGEYNDDKCHLGIPPPPSIALKET